MESFLCLYVEQIPSRIPHCCSEEIGYSWYCRSKLRTVSDGWRRLVISHQERGSPWQVKTHCCVIQHLDSTQSTSNWIFSKRSRLTWRAVPDQSWSLLEVETLPYLSVRTSCGICDKRLEGFNVYLRWKLGGFHVLPYDQRYGFMLWDLRQGLKLDVSDVLPEEQGCQKETTWTTFWKPGH